MALIQQLSLARLDIKPCKLAAGFRRKPEKVMPERLITHEQRPVCRACRELRTEDVILIPPDFLAGFRVECDQDTLGNHFRVSHSIHTSTQKGSNMFYFNGRVAVEREQWLGCLAGRVLDRRRDAETSSAINGDVSIYAKHLLS